MGVDHVAGTRSRQQGPNFGPVVEGDDDHGRRNLARSACRAPLRHAATSHAVDPRLILPEHITAEHLTHLMTNGTTIRTTRGAHQLGAGWLTICRVDRTGTLTFDQDPTTAADTDWLIQLGPGLTTTRDGDCVDESLLPGS